MIELQTLGGLDLRDAKGRELRGVLRQPKRFALLAYLAVATPRGFHRRDTLVAAASPDGPGSWRPMIGRVGSSQAKIPVVRVSARSCFRNVMGLSRVAGCVTYFMA